MHFALSLMVALTLATTAHATPQRYAIEEVMLPATATLVKKSTVKSADVGAEIGKLVPSVAVWCASKAVSVTGAPYARFHKYDPKGDTELEAGFPAITAQPLEDGIVESSLPAGRALTTRHNGPYEKIGGAYEALHVYMEKGHLVGNGGPWEVYLNDPTTVPPEQIMIEVYYPVK